MAQFQGVDSTAIGSIGAPMYGHLYQDYTFGGGVTEITVASANTYYGWTTATAGQLQGITADTSDATADHLTVPADGAGDYFVSATAVSANAKTTADTILMAVHVDGTAEPGLVAHQATTNVSEWENLHVQGVIALAANEEVSLRFGNDTSTDNIQITGASLSIFRIGN